MKCERNDRWLALHDEGLLEGRPLVVLRRHLEACGTCRLRLGQYSAGRRLLTAELRRVRTDPGFTASVMESVRAEGSGARRTAGRPARAAGRRLARRLAAGAVAAVLCFLPGPPGGPWSTSTNSSGTAGWTVEAAEGSSFARPAGAGGWTRMGPGRKLRAGDLVRIAAGRRAALRSSAGLLLDVGGGSSLVLAEAGLRIEEGEVRVAPDRPGEGYRIECPVATIEIGCGACDFAITKPRRSIGGVAPTRWCGEFRTYEGRAVLRSGGQAVRVEPGRTWRFEGPAAGRLRIEPLQAPDRRWIEGGPFARLPGGTPRTPAALGQLLRTAEASGVRREAVMALGTLGGAEARDILVEKLRTGDPAPEVLVQLLRTLVQAGSPPPLVDVVEYLRNPFPEVRTAAVECAERAYGRAVAPELRALTPDIDPEVRRAVREALRRLGK